MHKRVLELVEDLDLRDKSIPLPPLYHVSPYEFLTPCIEMCTEKAIADEKHPNGVLGLWTSPFPRMFESTPFGPHVYSVTLHESAREVLLPYQSLRELDMAQKDLADDCPEAPFEFYASLREIVGKDYDVLYVADGSRSVGEVIIVNLDVIKGFERTNTYDNTKTRLIGMSHG
jgi:hypothetical protein